jgi:hypothetical protein
LDSCPQTPKRPTVAGFLRGENLWLTEHGSIISIFSDHQYMQNMWQQLVYIKLLEKKEAVGV